MSVRRSLILLFILMLGIPLGFFGYGIVTSRDEGLPESLTYFTVGRGDVRSIVNAVGAIEAEEVLDLSFTLPGRVAETYVESADYVLAGDLLIRLENDVQRLSYEQAVLNLETAEINLDDLVVPVDEEDVRIAEADVDAAWGAYQGIQDAVSDDDIRAAEAQVQQAEVALERARERRLIGGGFDEEEDVRLADAAVGSASFQLEIARRNLDELQTGRAPELNAAYARVLEAQAELERVLAGPRDLEIEEAEVRVEQAQIRLERAEEALRDTEIRAPFDGFVARVDVEPGSLVTPGVAVVELVDVEPLSLTVQVDEIDIGNLEPGMPAFVEVDALPDVELAAELERISLVGNALRGGIVNYDAELRLEEADPRVRVGMTAEANLITNRRSDVLIAPNAFIRLDRRNNTATVNRLAADGTLNEVSVTLGLRGDQYSQVLDGLDVGDIIAVDLTGNQVSLFGG